MAASEKKSPQHAWHERAWKWLASVRVGIVLLILVALAAAAGTLVLQRTMTDPEKMAQAYSPKTLEWLDATGLTDVFHSPWFLGLMILLCINIICASIDRFPNVWRYFSRPYLRPDPHFLNGLPLREEIAVRNSERGMEVVERALARMGFRARHIGNGKQYSLFAEKYRAARLAAYVVHVSLLLILGGGIVDGIWGYRGFIALTQNEQLDKIELQHGEVRQLPFAIRCDGAGQENYQDGTPKRWWSKLAVVENGKEILKKEIAVNDPLTYGGIRFFQSSYGETGQVDSVQLEAAAKNNPQQKQSIVLRQHDKVQLDPDISVHLSAFVPDLVIVGDQIQTRSNKPNNPAIQLCLESKTKGEMKVWLFPKFPGMEHNDAAPYRFAFRDLQMGYFTGLQAAYEPGQWAVWAGCVLMVVGLVMAFYMVHVRIWALPVSDDRGRTAIWLGASASKNREEFAERFRKLVQTIEEELKQGAAAAASMREASAVGD